MLLVNGIQYIIYFIYCLIKNWNEITQTGWSRIIYHLFFDFDYLIGSTFVIVGIYTISKGAKLAGVRGLKKRIQSH